MAKEIRAIWREEKREIALTGLRALRQRDTIEASSV